MELSKHWKIHAEAGLSVFGRELARVARIWRDDVLSFVPQKLRDTVRRCFGLERPITVLVDENGTCRVLDDADGASLSDAALVAARARLLHLRFEDAAILRRQLTVPSAAAARLDTVLLTNLGTWTPFTSDDVHACAQTVEDEVQRSRALTLIEVRCVMREAAARKLDALRLVGLEPDSLELGDPRFVVERPTLKRRHRGRVKAVLAALCCLFAIQAAVLFLVVSDRQWADLAALEQRRSQVLRALQERASAEKAVRQQREAWNKISARAGHHQSLTFVLETLAQALPAATFIREFEASRDRGEGRIVAVGRTDTDLGRKLFADPLFRPMDVAVSTNADGDRRLTTASFAISTWAQAGAPAGR